MNLEKWAIEDIEALLDAMPFDASFVDKEDKVAYFNTPAEGRIFPRTKLDLGRNVRNCHPPKSVHLVEKILAAFRSGEKKEARFWIQMGAKFILIEYFPVRSKAGEYLGTLEVTRDVTDIRTLEGENRLLSWE
jgi:DUF438 domain-containing protein